MAEIIPLDTIPNQSLSVRLEDRRYVLTLKDIGGMMAVTVERDSVTLVDGIRACAGTPIIPYPFLSDGDGSFIFINTDPEAIPYYEDFGTKCQLVYLTAAELTA